MATSVQNKETIRALIARRKHRVKSLGVKRLQLFGSFARGEQKHESDIDFLVKFAPRKKTLKNLVALGDFLEDLLGRHVELITRESLDPYIGPYILREVQSGGRLSMPKSPIPNLRHILNEANYLIKHTKRLKKSKFLSDDTLLRGFVRSLEIIGEATKRLPTEFREKYTQVDWKGMAGMRDRLIHEYDTVDYDTVWDVVTKEVPPLQKKIEVIIEEESNSK